MSADFSSDYVPRARYPRWLIKVLVLLLAFVTFALLFGLGIRYAVGSAYEDRPPYKWVRVNQWLGKEQDEDLRDQLLAWIKAQRRDGYEPAGLPFCGGYALLKRIRQP